MNLQLLPQIYGNSIKVITIIAADDFILNSPQLVAKFDTIRQCADIVNRYTERETSKWVSVLCSSPWWAVSDSKKAQKFVWAHQVFSSDVPQKSWVSHILDWYSSSAISRGGTAEETEVRKWGVRISFPSIEQPCADNNLSLFGTPYMLHLWSTCRCSLFSCITSSYGTIKNFLHKIFALTFVASWSRHTRNRT